MPTFATDVASETRQAPKPAQSFVCRAGPASWLFAQDDAPSRQNNFVLAFGADHDDSPSNCAAKGLAILTANVSADFSGSAGATLTYRTQSPSWRATCASVRLTRRTTGQPPSRQPLSLWLSCRSGSRSSLSALCLTSAGPSRCVVAAAGAFLAHGENCGGLLWGNICCVVVTVTWGAWKHPAAVL